MNLAQLLAAGQSGAQPSGSSALREARERAQPRQPGPFAPPVDPMRGFPGAPPNAGLPSFQPPQAPPFAPPAAPIGAPPVRADGRNAIATPQPVAPELAPGRPPQMPQFITGPGARPAPPMRANAPRVDMIAQIANLLANAGEGLGGFVEDSGGPGMAANRVINPFTQVNEAAQTPHWQDDAAAFGLNALALAPPLRMAGRVPELFSGPASSGVIDGIAGAARQQADIGPFWNEWRDQIYAHNRGQALAIDDLQWRINEAPPALSPFGDAAHAFGPGAQRARNVQLSPNDPAGFQVNPQPLTRDMAAPGDAFDIPGNASAGFQAAGLERGNIVDLRPLMQAGAPQQRAPVRAGPAMRQTGATAAQPAPDGLRGRTDEVPLGPLETWLQGLPTEPPQPPFSGIPDLPMGAPSGSQAIPITEPQPQSLDALFQRAPPRPDVISPVFVSGAEFLNMGPASRAQDMFQAGVRDPDIWRATQTFIGPPSPDFPMGAPWQWRPDNFAMSSEALRAVGARQPVTLGDIVEPDWLRANAPAWAADMPVRATTSGHEGGFSPDFRQSINFETDPISLQTIYEPGGVLLLSLQRILDRDYMPIQSTIGHELTHAGQYNTATLPRAAMPHYDASALIIPGQEPMTPYSASWQEALPILNNRFYDLYPDHADWIGQYGPSLVNVHPNQWAFVDPGRSYGSLNPQDAYYPDVAQLVGPRRGPHEGYTRNDYLRSHFARRPEYSVRGPD